MERRMAPRSHGRSRLCTYVCTPTGSQKGAQSLMATSTSVDFDWNHWNVPTGNSGTTFDIEATLTTSGSRSSFSVDPTIVMRQSTPMSKDSSTATLVLSSYCIRKLTNGIQSCDTQCQSVSDRSDLAGILSSRSTRPPRVRDVYKLSSLPSAKVRRS